MFKLRRRTVAATAVSDLPFCAMCGTAIRVDAASGRCALGHRVAVVDVAPVVATDDTAVLEPVETYDVSPAHDVVAYDTPVFDAPVYDSPVAAYVEDSAGIAGEGLYEAYQSAADPGRTVTWEDVVAPPAAEGGGVYDDYLTWDQPVAGFSSLDVDTAELPVSEAAVEDGETTQLHPLPADLLDELDDAAHARRRAVGTIGATLGFSALVFASIAVLPF